MTSENTMPFSEADITNTAEKLVAFASTLAPAEQAVVAHMLTLAARAGQAASEVSGYFTLIELKVPLVLGEVNFALSGAFALLPAVQSRPQS